MTQHQQKKSLSVMTVDQLKELIQEHNLGGEIDYDVIHVYGGVPPVNNKLIEPELVFEQSPVTDIL